MPHASWMHVSWGRPAQAEDSVLRSLDHVFEYGQRKKIAPFLVSLGTGAEVPFSTLLKKDLTVLILWADWCPPCVQELKSLDLFLEKQGPALDRASGIQIIPVAIRQYGASIIPVFFKRHGLRNLPSYWNKDADILSRLQVPALPTTLFLDSEGNEVYRATAALDWMAPNTLETLLLIQSNL